MINTRCLSYGKSSIYTGVIGCLVYVCLMLSCNRIYAQESLNIPNQNLDFFDHLGKQERPFSPSHEFSNNAEPELQLPLIPEPRGQQLSNQLTLHVKHIELIGNTVFSQKELNQIIQAYEGKQITSSDLFKLRDTLNLFYIKHGYINSGAIIPDQDVTDGIIKIKIIEGTLNEINLSGNDWLNEAYIIERLRLHNETILNLDKLQDQLKNLHQNRLIEYVNAELLPGKQPGESELNINVVESQPYRFNVSFNNARNPSVGELQGLAYGEVMNLTGNGDALLGYFSITEGLDNGGVNYAFPVSAYDTIVSAFYEQTEADVIEKPFASLAIESTSLIYGIGIEQPVYLSPQSKLLFAMQLERKESKTRILGRPFSFSSGPENGRSKITALRFIGEWVNQGKDHALALRSTFNLGLDVFDATQNKGDIADGQFFSWLGQFQWTQRIKNTGIKLLLRSDLQLAADPLLPMEKMGVGGYYSVRGYRENQLVRDNGWVASIEARLPLHKLPILGIQSEHEQGSLEFAVFYDYGWSENLADLSQEPKTLSSIGVGLRWDPHPRIHSEFYWGYALRDIDNQGEDSLQDNGMHFVLNIELF